MLRYGVERVDAADKRFDATVWRTRAGVFAVPVPPEPRNYRDCSLRTLRRAEDTIGREAG